MSFRTHDANSPQRPLTPEPHQGKQSFRSGMLQRLHNLFSRDSPLATQVQTTDDIAWPDQPPPQSQRDWSTRPVGVGLPRQATFKRQNSERRERLLAVEPCGKERRAFSNSRQISISLPRRRANSTPPPNTPARISAPTVAVSARSNDVTQPDSSLPLGALPDQPPFATGRGIEETQRPPRPASITSSLASRDALYPDADNKAQINAELDTRWILNLSMHFRDKSDREKFFVTYAETPRKWRRVTVSADYRNAEQGSLEMDLKELSFQRDKSMQIYESIRDSLPEIQFYDTVTNLKLETSDSRLHVHVTEDQNEIIPYPPRSTVAHLFEDDGYRPKEVRESDLTFKSHLSGFVYKVDYDGMPYIKKEIPGPDTVDEFLYEINALHALYESTRVIRLEAIVVDDTHQLVKGLLISFAEQGAIVDLLYDHRGKIPLIDRLMWARDAVIGLSDIHEEGYVQGDFTLSNIVVDAEGNAKIIDINRRGCPVGWEPPEIRSKIASHQRISMYIGEKSDLYQLGMSLWGLAADDDEPERHDPPLTVEELPDEVPLWFKEIVKICLSDRPRDRKSAKELAQMFPVEITLSDHGALETVPELGYRAHKRYIDPSHAVEREDIDRFKSGYPDDEMLLYSPQSSRDDYTFTYPRSSEYDRKSDLSDSERPRGRRPPTNLEHLNHRERRAWSPNELASPAFDDEDANIVEILPGRKQSYEAIDFEGKPFLIARNTFSDDEMKILERINTADQPEPAGKPSGMTDLQSSEAEKENVHAISRPRAFKPKLSATSSSTPRNSAAVLPELTSQQLAELNGESVESGQRGEYQGQLEISSNARLPGSRVTRHCSSSNSPQPPASLYYADSGFHEPPDFGDVDERPSEQNPEEYADKSNVATTSNEETDTETENQKYVKNVPPEPTSQISPPPLLRHDTSIRISDISPPDVVDKISPEVPVTTIPDPIIKSVDTARPPTEATVPEAAAIEATASETHPGG